MGDGLADEWKRCATYTRINPVPCPRCGGKLVFKDTCGSLKPGHPYTFFSAKTAVTFIQLSNDLRKCALSVAVLVINK
jgi:hypothetical protein